MISGIAVSIFLNDGGDLAVTSAVLVFYFKTVMQ